MIMKLWQGIFVVLLSWQSTASVPTAAIEEMVLCCETGYSFLKLLRCIESSSKRTHRLTSNIAIVTYLTDNIAAYAAYALAINTMYAATNSLPIYILSPGTGHEYEPRDQRWNRVKIIQDGFDNFDGFLKSFDYVLWIDSDLIFLDMQYNLTAIVALANRADIIISSERHAETGVANTGMFLIKNTEWSKRFLFSWWENFDRTLNHDQVFFDKLYKDMLPDIKSHVTILPTEAMNSIPPAMIFQEAKHQILHMMGERGDLRSNIFAAGWNEICRVYKSKNVSSIGTGKISTQIVLKPQLGLNREFLQKTAIVIFKRSVNDNLKLLQSLSAPDFLPKISEIRETLLQIIKIAKVSPDGKSLDKSVLRYQTTLYNRIVSSLTPQYWDDHSYLNALNLCAILGNDIVHQTLNREKKASLFNQIGDCLLELESRVGPASRPAIREMLGMHHQHVGDFEIATGTSSSIKNGIEKILMAVEVLEAAAADGGSLFRLVGPLMSLGDAYCTHGQRSKGLAAYASLIALLDELLFAEEQMKEDHLKLAQAHLNAGWCAVPVVGRGADEDDDADVDDDDNENNEAEEDMQALAEKHYMIVEDILKRHPERNSVAQFLPSLSKLHERIAQAPPEGGSGSPAASRKETSSIGSTINSPISSRVGTFGSPFESPTGSRRGDAAGNQNTRTPKKSTASGEATAQTQVDAARGEGEGTTGGGGVASGASACEAQLDCSKGEGEATATQQPPAATSSVEVRKKTLVRRKRRSSNIST